VEKIALMNTKFKYAVFAFAAVVMIVAGLAVINPRSEVDELLREFNVELGTGGTTTYGQIVGQLNKGDKLKIFGSLVGDPFDFFITCYFSNVNTHLEVARWKFASSNIGDIFWDVPEKGEYMLNFQSYGDHSEAHVFVYRKYVKPLFPW
jgi:hypothetical protein